MWLIMQSSRARKLWLGTSSWAALLLKVSCYTNICFSKHPSLRHEWGNGIPLDVILFISGMQSHRSRLSPCRVPLCVLEWLLLWDPSVLVPSQFLSRRKVWIISINQNMWLGSTEELSFPLSIASTFPMGRKKLLSIFTHILFYLLSKIGVWLVTWSLRHWRNHLP